MPITLNRETLEPILVNVPVTESAIGSTKSFRVSAGEVLKECRELFTVLGSNHKVPVIRHQFVRQNRQWRAAECLLDQIFKVRVIRVAGKELLTQCSAIEHVIDIARLYMTFLRNHDFAASSNAGAPRSLLKREALLF